VSLPKNLRQFDTLVAIMRQLRGPEGCPWDKKQTHASLRENLLGESYEVLQALDEGDPQKLCEELGDLLMQIIFHTQIAEEAGEFQLEDVLERINRKLVRRHPHIFGSQTVKNAEEVAQNWEEIKRAERAPGASILESVPRNMPALSYSQEIQRRVAQAGFDWEDIGGVIEKLAEEIQEYQQAQDQKEKVSEFGDLLFTLVNFARRQDINSEASLREANLRFYKRYTCMEELCRQRGLSFNKLTFDEQNALWEEAKKAVG
jgi:tetrapyrrole methylase family protein/MazG family protein